MRSRDCWFALTFLGLVSPAFGQQVFKGIQPALPEPGEALGRASARAPARAEDPLALYRLPAREFQVKLGRETVRRRHSVASVEFPSPLSARWPTVTGKLYRPRQRGESRPAVVVVHHLGGSHEVERYLAQHLAGHGVVAFAIELPNYGPRRRPGSKNGFLHAEDPEGALQGFRQAALDVIRASDMLRGLPEVKDDARVGLAGVSLGALVAGLARGVDRRLGRTVLVLGGGDLPGIARAGAAERGIDLGPLEAQLRRARYVDPLTFAHRVETNDVVMINAKRDEVIPPESTRKLWRALGEPKLKWLDCGHVGAALHVLSIFNLTLDHLSAPDCPG